MDELLLVFIPGACVGAVIGYFIGNAKGRGGEGAVWGFFLGPIGWLVLALGPDFRIKCPLCKGALPDGKVSRCRHCGQQIKSAARQTMLPPIEGSQWDPVDAWESQQQAKKVLPVPEHLKSRKLDE